ncbi:hypothetical protein NW768_009711 [Fusarium equiseti]|uniref:Nephrocystin 3-like N-terminal domain-containing protein n=1 Tax=Fusarium equiseti TaxID=61235 RepID=A0ABQ8R2B8_FUSEQ|nr:hypothetical protein NW768_009711 [Fusarium equiseti]
MDPITAFQVAGTVITFVEFSRELLNGAREVYKSPSGTTSRVVRLSSIVDDLTTAGDSISASMRNSPTSSQTRSDETLVNICQRCTVLKDELRQALQGLEARGDTKFDLARRSIAVAFKSIWSQGKINDLDRRLNQVQSEMKMAVLMSLWEEERVHGRSRQEYLNQNMDAILASVNKTDQRIEQLMQDLLQASSHEGSQGTNQRSMLFRELWKADWRPDRDTIQGFETISWDGHAHFIEQDVINSLWFDAIESRDRAISETFESTYEWILDPNGSTCFTTWMEENQSLLYWITGKAGSGKSTLMKYLVHHESTIQHLRIWSGDMPLLFCYFYFWEATSEELQHSRKGLVRSLLWQCLSKRPELVRKVTPRRWAAYHALRGWEGPVPEWGWEELQETFYNLASLNNSNFKLVMFIDGLDEFDGNPATLILWIKDLITKFSIKLCVGSRPWNAFSDAFNQYPTLTMQTLTAPDIQTYINGHLNTNSAFRDWQALSPNGTEALRKDLLEKADGVFLWVYVVVRELLLALERGRNLHDLSVILDSLPTDIMTLYTKIYGTADPEEAKRAALYFNLIKAAVHEVTSYELWYIEEGTAIDPNDATALISMRRMIKRRLDSSTRGMVECLKDEFIVFHHRSVHEWLFLPGVLPILSGNLPEHFDARLLLMKGHRARHAQGMHVDPDRSIMNLTAQRIALCEGLFLILYYAAHVAESPVLTSELLQELELARDTFDKLAESLEKSGEEVLLFLAELRAESKPTLPEQLKKVLLTHARRQGKVKGLAAGTVKPDDYGMGHWSLNLAQCRPRAQKCFSALAAQFAVYPYVMAQVKERPGLLEEKNDRMSLLHCAIFGPQPIADHPGPPLVDHRLRLRLIKALLDCGASLKGRMHYGHRKYDDWYLDAIYGKKNWETVGPEEYWIEVDRLLTVRMSKVALFRRSLGGGF